MDDMDGWRRVVDSFSILLRLFGRRKVDSFEILLRKQKKTNEKSKHRLCAGAGQTLKFASFQEPY